MGFTGTLAGFAARRPWLVVGIWILVLVAAGFFASGIGDVLTDEDEVYADLEALTVEDLIEERIVGGEEPPVTLVLLRSEGMSVDDPAFRAVADQVFAAIASVPEGIEQVVNYYETGDPSLVSPDGDTLQVPVVLADLESELLIREAIEPLRGTEGFTVVAIGDEIITEVFNETAEGDLQAELMALPIAAVILVIVFGALAAAGVPILLALLAIVVAVGLSALVGQAWELSTFVTNFITMMGLAVGIDYSLLVVQRFREERAKGLPRDAAIEMAGATATRAVFFSGLAVMVALAGLLIVPHSIFRSLALGAIVVVIAAVAAAMTLLPAVLRLMGDRVNLGRIRIPGRKESTQATGRFWTRTANFVMKHAVISVVATIVILAATAIPYAGITLGFGGIGLLPEETDVRIAFDILDEEFSVGVLEPARIAVDAPDVEDPAVQQGIDSLLARLAEDPDFGAPEIETSPAGDLAVIDVPVRGDPEADLARDAINRLRGDYVPDAFAGVDARVLVGGQTAGTLDFSALIDDYTPIVFAFVLGLSFLILLVVFRSIVVPLKAILMNLLSVGAAYGLMVLVFQHGIGTGLLGFQQVDVIEAWIPLFMFAIIFGLSMDYHVFLLARIREHYDRTGNNRDAVAFGVRSTAGIITGAALIMVAVFGGFAAGELVMFQQMGFGLAVAIILDATIIRIVLVPASMALLGDWNWYLPGWLSWLPTLDIEGHHASTPTGTSLAPSEGAAGGD